MAYKDKDKQREAQREWVRQKRKGSTISGSTEQGSTQDVTDSNYPTTDEPKESFVSPKRGKDIKCFSDLPADVQGTINKLSDSEEEFQRRVAIAVNYQHLFPDRYYPTGAY